MAKLKRLFLNGHLHRVLHVARSQDLVTLYDYVDGKKKVYPWSEAKRKMQNAFTIKELSDLIGRSVRSIHRYIDEGIIEPQKEYRISDGLEYRYFFSEDMAMELYDYLCGVHIGRPRKDGKITNNTLPTREEMLTQLRTKEVLYRKTESGDFVPVWKAQDW